MNRLMREIKSYISGLEESGDKIMARFLFPSDFTGFKGHFPGRPVLPGVCKIQAVIAMLELWHQKNICIKEISTAKFFSPVFDNQELIVTTNKINELNGRSGEAKIKASVISNGKKISDFNLLLKVS
jgi:3-hydroxymyristoyl/3-hydroxydecanoyl-(acyl carrier protein) dehydratase